MNIAADELLKLKKLRTRVARARIEAQLFEIDLQDYVLSIEEQHKIVDKKFSIDINTGEIVMEEKPEKKGG